MGGIYIIKNATVVSVDEHIGTVPNCDVLIENELISAVGPKLQHPPNAIFIDGTNTIVSPGFIDTHRHTWQTQLRTIGSDYVLSDYILNLRQLYGASYTPRDAYLGNFCGALDSIENGITCLIDHSHIVNTPAHADAAIQGLQDSKIRATYCYAMYPNPHWKGSCMDEDLEKRTPDWRLHDIQRVSEEFFQSDLSDADSLVRMGFALSEPDLTPIDQLINEIKFARLAGCRVITGHFSNGKTDPGNYIIRQLGQKGLLGPDLIVSHGNTFANDELELLATYKCGISSTPDTELQMGMSHPIAFKAKDRGCVASLGVDVCCSSPVDMFAQMRLLLQAQRHLEHEAGDGPPLKISRKCEEVLEMATMGGARAVGLANAIGSITPGKRADLLITRCDALRLVPAHNPVGTLVLYANGADIDTVMINGEVVKSGGKLTNIDWPTLRDELRESTAAILERSKKAPVEELEAARSVFMKSLTCRNQRNNSVSS